MSRFALILLLFFVSTTFSQVNDTIKNGSIEEILISKVHINDSLMNAPASIGIATAVIIQSSNLSDISPAVNRIAGVQMQTGAFNTNRISIRGIGARTPFGTNKIRAFYGSIPLTSGDSETTIEDIDVETISSAEIIKGPLSSIYGSGLGGAILLNPIAAKANRTIAEVSSVFGSFGLLKSRIAFSLANETSDINISYHNLQTDGWRQNSSYDREGVTLTGTLFKRPQSKLTYLFNYTEMLAFIPSSINTETFENNPQAAAPTWLAAKGYEQYESYIGGLSYDFKIFSLSNTTSVFINFKDSYEPRPFDILAQDTKGYGLRTQFTDDFHIRNLHFNYIFGLEYFNDGFSGSTSENLYSENNGNGSLEGERLTASEQKRNFYNVFAQLRAAFSDHWEVQAGLNVNQTSFSLKNRFPAESLSSEEYKYDAIWSPQISLLYKPSRNITLYSSASRGFSLPSVEETLNANGMVNSDIKPESGYNLEIGSKAYFFGRKIYAEMSFYHMQIENLLVARRIADDQYVGVNAGKTLHQGIELTVNGNWSFSKLIVSPFMAASIGKYKFIDFNDNDNDFSGNDLTGVPNIKVNCGIAASKNGFSFAVDYQYVDKLPINDANTIYNDSWQLVNLKGGYELKMTKNLTGAVSAGVNNVFDEHYASMVLVNASAPPNGTPRYYYPGMPVNYYCTLKFSYILN